MNFIKLEEIDLEKLDILLVGLVRKLCPRDYDLSDHKACDKNDEVDCEDCWVSAIKKEV